MLEKVFFCLQSAAISCKRAVMADDPMAGHDYLSTSGLSRWHLLRLGLPWACRYYVLIVYMRRSARMVSLEVLPIPISEIRFLQKVKGSQNQHGFRQRIRRAGMLLL